MSDWFDDVESNLPSGHAAPTAAPAPARPVRSDPAIAPLAISPAPRSESSVMEEDEDDLTIDAAWLSRSSNDRRPAPSAPASIPDRPGPTVASAAAPAERVAAHPADAPGPAEPLPPSAGPPAHVEEVLRHMDVFYAGLVQMERRLGTAESSFAKITERWIPLTK